MCPELNQMSLALRIGKNPGQKKASDDSPAWRGKAGCTQWPEDSSGRVATNSHGGHSAAGDEDGTNCRKAA